MANQLWEDYEPTISESPYVVSYKQDDFQRIQEMKQREEKALNDYWITQPELQEPAFQAQLHKALEADQNVAGIWELEKYRLNKRIPNTLPFEKRKELLINSKEWNGWVHQHNKHLSEDELTADNIQKEIDSVAICWGIEITKKYQKLEWLPTALDREICKIYIPCY